METVKTKFDLKHAKEDIVMVASVDMIFQRQGTEWIAKTRFTKEEVAKELEIPYSTLVQWIDRLHMPVGKLNLDDIRKIIRVKELRAAKISFKKIPERIKNSLTT